MQPCIRPALSDDISDLCRLYVEFHQFHVQGVPGRLVSLGQMEPPELVALADNLRGVLEHPRACVLVAEAEGTILGFVEAYDRKTEPHPLRVQHRYLYIQSLYVRKPYRRLRLGKALLLEAGRWGRKRGLREVQLDSWEFPGGPQPFYETLGFSTLRRTLVARIETNEDEHAK